MLLPLLCKQKPLMPHKHRPPQRPQRPHLKPPLLPELVKRLEKPLLKALRLTEAEGVAEMAEAGMVVEMPQALPGLETVKKRAD
jgi:hypothetical protein